jgi:hypothetical protein
MDVEEQQNSHESPVKQLAMLAPQQQENTQEQATFIGYFQKQQNTDISTTTTLITRDFTPSMCHLFHDRW